MEGSALGRSGVSCRHRAPLVLAVWKGPHSRCLGRRWASWLQSSEMKAQAPFSSPKMRMIRKQDGSTSLAPPSSFWCIAPFLSPSLFLPSEDRGFRGRSVMGSPHPHRPLLPSQAACCPLTTPLRCSDSREEGGVPTLLPPAPCQAALVLVNSRKGSCDLDPLP